MHLWMSFPQIVTMSLCMCRHAKQQVPKYLPTYLPAYLPAYLPTHTRTRACMYMASGKMSAHFDSTARLNRSEVQD